MTEFEVIGERWIKQALYDLQITDRNISIEFFDSAAFYSHQFVEKLLKGLISFSGKSIPRTHDLEHLGDFLECPDDIMPDLIDLLGDYQTSRYPDMSDIIPCEYYTKDIAVEQVRKAKKIFSVFYFEGYHE